MKTITTKQLKNLLQQQKIFLLDVREQDEFDAGHIEQAQLFPLSKIQDWSKNLDINQDYYLICRSGRRSQKAGEYLEQQNFHITNVTGGMLDWQWETLK